MIPLSHVLAVAILFCSTALSYSWTPVSPNQSFPLPYVRRSPEILPDPEDEIQPIPKSPLAQADNTSKISPEMGWLTPFVRNQEAQPWPIRGILKKRNRVRFCYATAETKKTLECTVRNAIKVWEDSLGGPAGKASGHNLAFKEVNVAGKTQLCYKEFDYEAFKGTMNRFVSSDVLAIYVSGTTSADLGVSESTIGYYPEETMPPEQLVGMRHTMKLASNAPIETVVHELGHGGISEENPILIWFSDTDAVLGMAHEMKRQDRDDFVEFRCDKVIGFDMSFEVARWKRENRGMSLDAVKTRLCTDFHFAADNYFIGTEFVKTDGSESGSRKFDMDSIMMYGSGVVAKDKEACQSRDISECEMVKITKAGGVKIGVERIPVPTWPSKGDVDFVRKYYPWTE